MYRVLPRDVESSRRYEQDVVGRSSEEQNMNRGQARTSCPVDGVLTSRLSLTKRGMATQRFPITVLLRSQYDAHTARVIKGDRVNVHRQQTASSTEYSPSLLLVKPIYGFSHFTKGQNEIDEIDLVARSEDLATAS
ncbi:hypothetical protein G5I_02716 [Acromyrmex echinatior]|uniref:Uncharacterized protein n=1 Tax=Acromyrmex echinatior TaxID=103372 RepID=F4WAZ5_ACREC|nr:hypothetical protein G5I_02716 [Acromyrmex echinatior]